MPAVVKTGIIPECRKLARWPPLVVLPTAAAWLASGWPPWVFMWLLAFAIYVGLKWLTFADAVRPAEAMAGRSLGYLLLWPGMDAKSFFANRQSVVRPSQQECLLAAGKLALGAMLLVAAAATVDQHPTVAAWVGMAGIVFSLHFGLFHLLSILWRRAGVNAPPLMDAPILSSSLSDFWGKRWNLAFRDLAHGYVFRPLAARRRTVSATLAVFLVSGVVHDVVISLPARGGFGLPTLYFLIQGAGVLFQRSRVGKRVGASKGARGRLFCAAVTMGPVALLFHRPFVERVVIPMFIAVGGAWR